jgi:hypothetical protein
MNTLIANQYGRVQGEVGGRGPVLTVAAQTPRRDSVQLQTRLDSVEQQLYLLAILRAVERRIEQFQLRESSTGDSQAREPESPFEGTICSEGDLFNANGASKNKIYGRFAQFLIYEQVEQGRLRVFFAVRDDAKRVARFDLHPGEVQALCALKWSDLDLVNGWIGVNRSVDNNLENPCKNEASRKAVPVDLRIVPFFQRWYEVSLFKAPDDYVFAAGSNRAGGKRGKQPLSLSVVFRYHIKPVADQLGIRPAVFGWHTFRRSFASMVVGSTKDVKAAQELMRHSTSKLTLDLYAQALPENKVAASKAIAGSLLLPPPSTCTAVQSGQGTEEPVKLNRVNQSPSSSPA